MRGMMLNAQDRQFHRLRETSGAIVRMQIACDNFRRDIEHRQHASRGFLIEPDRGHGVEVADVVRYERLAPARDAERRLQMRAEGDYRRTILTEVDGFGCEAARSPD